MIEPSMIAFGSVISRITAREVMLLPEPDSPTMLRISRAPTLKEISSMMRMTPFSERKDTERLRTSSSVSAGAEGSAGIAHARVEPGIGDIDDGICDDDEERRIHHGRHDERQI